MKKLLFLLVLIFVFSNSYSQWIQSGNGITGDTVMISMCVKDSVLYSSGINMASYTGDVYKSTNSGSTWQKLNYPGGGVVVLKDNNIFLGTAAAMYVSTNSGNNWQNTLSKSIESIFMYNNIVFAGTNNSGIYFSSNNGQNWVQSNIANGTINSFQVKGNKVFAGYNSGVYVSTNMGMNWTPLPISTQHVNTLAVISDRIYAGTISNGIFYTTNDGQNWMQTSLNNKSIESIIPYNNYIFAGNYFNGTGSFYYSCDMGNTWIQRSQGFNPAILGVFRLQIYNNYLFAATPYAVWKRSIADIVPVLNFTQEVPDGFSLSQNFPNPFNPITKIKFTVPESGNNSNVTLKVFDMMGREVETLVNEHLKAGIYDINFNAENLSSGIYFYKLNCSSYSETKRMTLIK